MRSGLKADFHVLWTIWSNGKRTKQRTANRVAGRVALPAPTPSTYARSYGGLVRLHSGRNATGLRCGSALGGSGQINGLRVKLSVPLAVMQLNALFISDGLCSRRQTAIVQRPMEVVLGGRVKRDGAPTVLDRIAWGGATKMPRLRRFGGVFRTALARSWRERPTTYVWPVLRRVPNEILFAVILQSGRWRRTINVREGATPGNSGDGSRPFNSGLIRASEVAGSHR